MFARAKAGTGDRSIVMPFTRSPIFFQSSIRLVGSRCRGRQMERYTRTAMVLHWLIAMRASLVRVFVALFLSLASVLALAQAWPSKPIRWIVPFPAGGSTDIATRPVAERLRQVFGQSGIVENRTGAAGHIGMEYVAKSAPDGY